MTRRALVLAMAVGLSLAVAAPAQAHVEVSPTEAARGSTTTFTFSVPNESDTAKTVKIEIFLPENASFTEVTPRPVAGWTATATKTSAMWQGGTISGSDEVEFQLTVGPLPDADSITFKTLQTYDNGDVVRWIEPTPPGGKEPEHPSATVALTGVAAAPGTTTTTTTAPAAQPDDGGNNGRVVAVVIALLLVLVGGVGVAGRRRRSP